MIERNAREAAALMAALLESVRPLTLLTPLLLCSAGLLAGGAPSWSWLMLLPLALAQLVHGWRLWLDAGYFRLLAQDAVTLAGLDEHLHHVFGRTPPAVPRSLAERIGGTRALLRRYAVLTLACWLATLLLPLQALFK